MANTRIENGHLRIANELAEKLARVQLSGTEHRIIWAVWRKTIGWQKREDRISLSQLAKITEMNLRVVRRTLSVLVRKNIIIKKSGRDKNVPSNINILRFNKDYETWKTRDKIVLGQKCTQNQGQKCPTQKKRKQKSQKILKQEFFDLVDLLIEKMLENDPNAKVPDTEKKREDWAHDFRLLIEKDNRQIQEVREILVWSQRDSFWKSNIHSAGKFREKFPKLRLQCIENLKTTKQDPAERTRKELMGK